MIAPCVLELNAAILNIKPILRQFIGRDIEFCTEMNPDIGHIKADPGQIEQVLVNLVVNARDAMPQGGKLIIKTADITLDDNMVKKFHDLRAGDYVTLAISDTGTGMTDEVKSRLFEPFFTTKPHGKGTGLGLATCFEIVKQSNAHIQVHSELGKGTTFTIYFPRAQAPFVSLPPAHSLPTEVQEMANF